ncbi:MAG: AI-2E family transporter YdiK [Acidobacteria bacterium]|nr:AI-2E family transporter YdiK [Acidobacteriota bacterium]
MAEPRNDLARIVFSVLSLCALLMASLWIVLPFMAAIVWGATIVIATWPVLISLQKRLRGSRGLATAVLVVVLLSIVFVPFLMAMASLFGSLDDITAKLKALETMQVPPPPEWVAKVPVVGTKASDYWRSIGGEGMKDLVAQVAPYASNILKWFAGKAGSVGAALAQFLLTIVVAAVFYSNGEAAADRVIRFARRLAGDRGEGVMRLAGQAIRGVALGVVVTAIGQTLIAGVGLAIAGVPLASILTVLIFVLCIAQIGPILIMLPSVIWLYVSDQPGWGTFLLVWTVIVGTMDNVVRPILIKKGADLPLLLIFTGVIGGLISLGLIGIFVGPVILAVSHTLMEAWLDDAEKLPGSNGQQESRT